MTINGLVVPAAFLFLLLFAMTLAFVAMIIIVATFAAIAGGVDICVPAILHEVDWLAAGVVFVAVLAPSFSHGLAARVDKRVDVQLRPVLAE